MKLISAQNLKVHYPIRGGFFNRVRDYVKALDGVDFEIEPAKTYGLVGESGSGKSTIAKVLVNLENLTTGEILFKGKNVLTFDSKESIEYKRNVQIIFQDPSSALNPKKGILDIVGLPLKNLMNMRGSDLKNKVLELLDIVGISADSIYRYPHEFSGGQKQRIGIARAVATNPALIIADEPTSSLDLSVQAQVLNFMKKIQKTYGISYLFISHDLGVIQHLCDYIYIMHKGRYVEKGTKSDIYDNPKHIYTKRLLSAIPNIDPSVRDESHLKRILITEEYQRDFGKFYDDEGRVPDLKPLSETHYVAIRNASE